MSPHEHDAKFMKRALTLAAESAALASPNPQVGCVLVKKDKIIGEGAHLYDNLDHAEIVALKQAAERGLSPKGTTAYVTLEPCSHHGRTGPCADALIAAGIARCVVATADPNPFVAGKGIAKLRAAGIEVSVGLGQDEAHEINEAFAHFIQTRTPFVTLKAALSVDGKLAPPPALRKTNKPYWLTGPAALAEVHRLRHASDAILTGIGTVLADDPALTDRAFLLGDSGPLGSAGPPRRRRLLRVVLDTHLRIPLDSQLVRTAREDLLIYCGIKASPAKLAALEDEGAKIEPILQRGGARHGHLSLPTVLANLAERNILSLLLECGSHLNGSFLTQHLVDKAVLFYSETELGDGAVPFAHGIASPFLFEQELRSVKRTIFGAPEKPDACVTGYLTDPWPTTLHPTR
jgi:diaminohydroxyphosphoribosylaminopyrimidine deaminase/5-amino-6-(5-phosphoribosylamino)uracil reductase